MGKKLLKIVLIAVFGIIIFTGTGCGNHSKTEKQIFIETLDSIATESGTFSNFVDSAQSDSFTSTPE